jgi:spermidine synthase
MKPSNFQVLFCEPTRLGLLCLRRRELLGRPGTVVTEVTLDHELLMSSYITVSERALTSRALELHGGSELKILVGGLGLGYTAHEALTSERARSVCVIEYLPEVISWLEQDQIPLSAELKRDPRLRLVQGDVYGMLAGPPESQHDLILIDVDHSPDETLTPRERTSDAFYTEAGLKRALRHLLPGGILGVWSYAEHSPFADALRRVFREVRVEPVHVFNDLVDEEHTDWLFFARA